MEEITSWKDKNILKINREMIDEMEVDHEAYRSLIEPWLSAIFQSEHLSLLLGSGLTTALTSIAKTTSQEMGRIQFDKSSYSERIISYSNESAKSMDRGVANLEDDIRTATELLRGLKIGDLEGAAVLESELNEALRNFAINILKTEENFIEELLVNKSEDAEDALNYLKSFLISFASRTATRDRLNIFTTNYDRFIEYGCDMAGILVMDRFLGKIKPVFRSTKLEYDYHYNPPGIRGEPRYIEGVVRYTKLHGSVDWYSENKQITRYPIAFGSGLPRLEAMEDPLDHLIIYPNSSKDVETGLYPYADLFRDLSYATCRPNSAIITYGYSFGDSHINRVLEDMLTIPSTHIVIIAFDDNTGRIKRFFEKNNPAQFTLLIGNEFGDLSNLVNYYLPKASIDRISIRATENLEKRGLRQRSEADNLSGIENLLRERDVREESQ